MLPIGTLFVVLGALLAWVISRRITTPLSDLTAAAEAIAGGDLARRVRADRSDEVGRLADAFNAMADQVQAGYSRLDTGIKERTAELETAMTQLHETQEQLVRREKLAMLGQLASGVGHELRNPLGVMTNAVYYLEMIQPDAPPDVREYLGILRAQIGLAEKIVGDLLDFSRIRPPRRDVVAVADVVAAQQARLNVPAGVSLQVDVPEGLPRVSVDAGPDRPDPLQPAGQRHPGARGPRRRRPRRQQRRRQARAAPPAGRRARRPGGAARQGLRAAVHDQGPRHRPRPRGLAQPGRGQRRHADARRERARRALHPEPAAGGRRRRGMKTILVADDDRGMARTVCDILRRHGWEPTEVHSGEAAVEAAAAQRYAAVLMDVRMPGLNGVEAFRVIRESQPQTPVILMTAYAAPDLLSQAEREGVLQILPKPLPWGTLSSLLDKIGALEGSVLVVDDDPAFLETLEAVLGAAGRRVRRAMTIDEAVRLLAERPPRVVVLDLSLNGRQPRDSVLAIRRVNPAVVLILCSGHTRLMDETLSSLPPGWVFAGLIKPFPPRRLLDLLDSVNGN